MGPHPFPMMVRDFQRIIGVEAREQIIAKAGRPPRGAVPACVGGGSNAIGLFHAFIGDKQVQLIGCEASAGDGPRPAGTRRRCPAAVLGADPRMRTYLLAGRRRARTMPTHSISAGLDYPGVGPEHAWLHDTGRASYRPITDTDAMAAFSAACRTEGIIPAIESARARLGRPRSSWAANSAKTQSCWSTPPAAATRTSISRRDGSVTSTPGRASDRDRACDWASDGAEGRRGRRRCRVRTSRRARQGGSDQVTLLRLSSIDGAIAAGQAMARAGADVVEIGLPYSDPLMDGPVIQQAVHRALEGGVQVIDVLRTG